MNAIKRGRKRKAIPVDCFVLKHSVLLKNIKIKKYSIRGLKSVSLCLQQHKYRISPLCNTNMIISNTSMPYLSSESLSHLFCVMKFFFIYIKSWFLVAIIIIPFSLFWKQRLTVWYGAYNQKTHIFQFRLLNISACCIMGSIFNSNILLGQRDTYNIRTFILFHEWESSHMLNDEHAIWT